MELTQANKKRQIKEGNKEVGKDSRREAMKKGRKQTNNDATKTARKRCGEKASSGNKEGRQGGRLTTLVPVSS